jgi:hypothetical protein
MSKKEQIINYAKANPSEGCSSIARHFNTHASYVSAIFRSINRTHVVEPEQRESKQSGLKVTNIDRNACRMLREELTDALTTVANKYGLNIDLGRFTFNSSQFTTRMTVQTQSGVVAKEHDKQDTAIWFLKKYGLEDKLNKRFRTGNRTFTLSGAKPSRPKYPLEIIGSKGGRYKLSLESIKNVVWYD